MELFSTLPDDPDLQQEIAEAFLEEGPRLLLGIQNAVTKQDCVTLAETAHALKGALVQIGAQAAFDSTQELELLAQTGNLKGADDMLRILKLEMENLKRALASVARTTRIH